MELKHVEGKLVVKVDLDYKNSHTFEDGTKIVLERKYDNFDMKYVQPVNAIVISSDHIPAGSEIIIHHNSTHESNEVFNYTPLSGEVNARRIKYYSILETEAFAWRSGDEWLPLPGFDFALRLFKPYVGVIEGIEPTIIKDILWITTGEFKEKACITLKACDYQLIFQDVTGREGNLIRLRTSPNEKEQRDAEVVAIHNEYTDKILNGQLWVGLIKSDAKPINQYANV